MDVFTLYASISVDTSEYERGLDRARNNTNNFASVMKKGLTAAAAAGTAALAAASAAAVALTKSAVEGYAEYEQLVGGVETLFKDSADIVMEYARNAYMTAGLSANEYMETVTSFSASLLQGLGGDTAEAARISDMAITDMADNANKMGTSMRSIQDAYQGFAKQNYTMLDNLKLGYGGTQAEMIRLINDSGILEEKITSLDGITFDQIIMAIHAVQEQMGITGTTALEAGATIQGSIAAAKSAWQNLLVGIADSNQDLDKLIDNFVQTVETAAGNIIPRVAEAMKGLGSLVEKLSPIIAEKLPEAISSVLPVSLQAGASLLVGVVQGIISAVPALMESARSIVDTLSTDLTETLPDLIPAAVEVLLQIIDAILDNLDLLVDATLSIMEALAEGLVAALPILLEKAPEIIEKLVAAVVAATPKLLESAWTIITTIQTGIIDNLPLIGEAAGKILSTVVQGIVDLKQDLIETGWNIVTGIFEGIDEKREWFSGKVTGFFTGILDGVKNLLGIHSPSTVFRDEVGQYIALGVAAGIEDKKDEAVKAADDLARDVYSRSKEWADKQTKYQNYSLKEQIEVWEAIQSQFVAESKQYADAEEKLFDLRTKAREEYLGNVQSISDTIINLENEYADALGKRTQDILKTYGLFDAVPEQQKVRGQSLINNLKGQISAIEGFYSGLDELSERGVGAALVDEIRAMGPDAAGELSALLELSDEKLTEYAQLYQEKQELANQIAVGELAGLRDQTDAQILENLSALNDILDENAPLVGEDFMNGMAEGILRGESTVVDAAIEVARALIDAVKEETGVHSPSTVFAGIGGYMADGLGVGWEKEYSRVKEQIGRGLDFGTSSVDFASSGIGMSSAAIVNGLNSTPGGAGSLGNATLVLQLDNGARIASWLLSDLIAAADAAGTPIASGQYA